MIELIELKEELNAGLLYDWNVIPFAENRHKWLLEWYRSGDDGDFCFSFVSPRRRRYAFFTAHGRVIGTEIAGPDNGASIANYWESWGDSPARLDAILRLTPQHVLRRLYTLLDAIG